MLNDDLLSSQQQKTLYPSLEDNIQQIRTDLGFSTDIIVRKMTLGLSHRLPVNFLYLDGMVDTNFIQEFLIPSLMHVEDEAGSTETLAAADHFLKEIGNAILVSTNVQYVVELTEVYQLILSGYTIILIEGIPQAIAANTAQWKERSIQESDSQTVVRGPKEAFTENIRNNTTLLRRKIKSPNLWIETRELGSTTKTSVAIMYLHGTVDIDVLSELRSRLDQVDLPNILESGYIEHYIQEKGYSPFPTIYNTERPDIVAAALIEGRIAILVDNTPFVLIAPAIFVHFMQSPEDYYQRPDVSSLIRLLRYITVFISLLAPSLYIAITTYHQEMIPSDLIISLAAQREGIPFPAFVEAFMMETTFEILREAGIRLPKAVGQAVSIVGALVIGQAAVEAGLVTPGMVIIVSLTAIANFTFPAFNMGLAVRMLRFGFMILASTFGLFGILIGLIILLLHMSNLTSFGVPYITPITLFQRGNSKETIIRFPNSLLKKVKQSFSQTNTDKSLK